MEKSGYSDNSTYPEASEEGQETQGSFSSEDKYIPLEIHNEPHALDSSPRQVDEGGSLNAKDYSIPSESGKYVQTESSGDISSGSDSESDQETSSLVSSNLPYKGRAAEAGDGTQNIKKKRNKDLHRVVFSKDGLWDGFKVAYRAAGEYILSGEVSGNGILCHCCKHKVSPSVFEAHAGFGERRQPYHNIYTGLGLSLHGLSSILSDGHNLVELLHDDKCKICGRGEQLIPCPGCSKAFHAECLRFQPDAEWSYPCCNGAFDITDDPAIPSLLARYVTLRHGTIDQREHLDSEFVTRDYSSSVAPSFSSSSGTTRNDFHLKREIEEHTDEIQGCVICKNSSGQEHSNTGTIILCSQCEKKYHVGCLRARGLCDLKELPNQKWFCCKDCSRIQNFREKWASYEATVEADMELNKTGVDLKWHVLYGHHSPIDAATLSEILKALQERVELIGEQGQDILADMVCGKLAAEHDFRGVHCVVLTLSSVIISVGLVRIFGIDAGELLLFVTPKGSEGKGYLRLHLCLVERLLAFFKVKILIVATAEDQLSLWINKLRFRRMTEERLKNFSEEIPLLRFKNTVMLEREVTPHTLRRRNSTGQPATLDSTSKQSR